MKEIVKKHEPEFIGRVGTIILVQQSKRSWQIIFPDGNTLFGIESPYHSKAFTKDVLEGFEQQVSDKINTFLKTSFSDMFNLPNDQQENKTQDNNGE